MVMPMAWIPEDGGRRAPSARAAERTRLRRQLMLETFQDELAELTPSEMVALSQELRRMARRQQPAQLPFAAAGLGNVWLLGAVALLALPQVREALRPLFVAMAQGASAVGNNAQDLVKNAQEWVQDVVAEAQFQKLQQAAEAAAATAASGLTGVDGGEPASTSRGGVDAGGAR